MDRGIWATWYDLPEEGVRSAIFVEEARVDGPEVSQRSADMTPGPCIQMGSFNSGKLEDEDELGAWYAQWRLPCMETLPGCIGCRKLVSAASWANMRSSTNSSPSRPGMPNFRSMKRAIPKKKPGPTPWSESSSMRRDRPTWGFASFLPSRVQRTIRRGG